MARTWFRIGILCVAALLAVGFSSCELFGGDSGGNGGGGKNDTVNGEDDGGSDADDQTDSVGDDDGADEGAGDDSSDDDSSDDDSNDDGSSDDGASAESLRLEYQVLTVEVGENAAIAVAATDAGGTNESFIAFCSNDAASVTVGESSIEVTGDSLGEATVTVLSASGVSESVLVRVIDPKALLTDGLLITYVDQFTLEWTDAGSGADDNGSYWQAQVPEGYFALGSLGKGGWGNPSGTEAMLVVKAVGNSDALAAPTDYQHIWSDSGSGANSDASFWVPVPPEGYAACGVVAQLGYTKPSLDEVRCVRSDLVSNAKVGGWIWDDSGSGADADFGSWTVECPDAQNSAGKAYLKAGTFIGVAGHSAPTSHPALYVLNVHLPLVTDVPEASYAPKLSTPDEPEDLTESYLSKVVAVPFPLVYDASYSLHQKVASFPIYRVRREEFYEKAYFYNNLEGSTPIYHTVTTTTGISETDSTTYSHSVGLSITAEGGCELIGGSVSVTVSYQFGYETSSSLTVFQEQAVSQQVEIAPYTAGCLWHKTTRFSLMRNNNNWETVAGSAKDIPINSFIKGEYSE